jgi:glycosyltransferase involved in cell wall biosynthesis
VLKRLAHSYPFTLRIVSDSMERIDLADPGELCASFSPWSEATELGELQQFTMGIMPLPANEWAEGKCSLKALLYMACGAPAVCSAVGAATTIITNGEDGFLAGSDAEWYTALERLLKDEPLRARMAERARATVVSRYSVAATAPSLLALFRDACGIKG